MNVPTERKPFAIIQGEALALLRQLPSDSIDAVITDPPYSSGGQYRGDRAQSTGNKYVQNGTIKQRPDFQGDNRDQRSYAYWSTLWLSEALRVTKPGGALLVFADWRQLPTMTDTAQAGGWTWRGVVAWDKTEGARPRVGGFRNQAEYVVWATRGPFDPAVAERVGCLPGVYRFAVRQSDKHHQTGKPTDLMRELVRVCPPGGLILDPFAGSGTTVVAALQSGRRAIGFELSPDYAQVARSRCQEAAGGEACPVEPLDVVASVGQP